MRWKQASPAATSSRTALQNRSLEAISKSWRALAARATAAMGRRGWQAGGAIKSVLKDRMPKRQVCLGVWRCYVAQ